MAFLVLMVVLGFGLRAWRLDFPPGQYFDEIYYVDAAEQMLEGKEDPNNVHPPLGKLELALGIMAVQRLNDLGWNLPESVGWRLGSLVLGTAIIPLTFYLGWILPGGGRYPAFAAGTLVTLDFLHLVMSRIAMLDMYQAFWILLGLIATWHAVEARRARYWLLASLAALLFGAATACKWNGLFAATGAYLALNLLAAGGFRPVRAGLLALLFAALIALVYVGSYSQLFLREHAIGPKQFETIAGYHERMWKFRYNPKEFNHRYLSSWWTWPLDVKPVWYFYEEYPQPAPRQPELPGSEKTVQGVVALGCPLFWLPFTLFMIEAVLLAVAQRDRARGFLALTYFPQWLLWASATTGGFIYYMLPCIPIMALTTGLALSEWRDSTAWSIAQRCFWLALIVLFALFFPFLTAFDVPEPYFRKIFFLESWI